MALVNRSLAFYFLKNYCNNLEIWDQEQGKGKRRKGNFQMKKTLQIHS